MTADADQPRRLRKDLLARGYPADTDQDLGRWTGLDHEAPPAHIHLEAALALEQRAKPQPEDL